MSQPITKPGSDRGQRNAGQLGLGAELISLCMHLLMLWSVIAAMSRVDSSDRLLILGPLATSGLLLGFWLAKTDIQDLMAHSVAVWFGALSALVLVGSQSTSLGEVISNRGQSYRDLVTGIGESLIGNQVGPVEDRQLLAVLGLTSWLLAYSSAWVVYRRRWYAAGIGVPAAILLTSLRVDDRNGGWPLAFFLIGAIGLGARDSYAGKVRHWSIRRMPAASGMARAFLFAGIPIAVVSVLTAQLLAPIIENIVSDTSTEKIEELWNDVSDDVLGRLGMQTPGSGNYTTFPSEWEIGGELNPTDEIVARVSSTDPHYLALRRYNVYTGNGWQSDVQTTFTLPGESSEDSVTHVTFKQGTRVPLSSQMTGQRASEIATVDVERPKGDLLFTIESFTGATTDVQAVMSWTLLDAIEIDVDAVDIADVPIDLQGLVSTAKQQEFSADADGITFDDPAVNREFLREVNRLAAYPITVRLEQGEDGQLVAIFDGRLPNYDDIESVFSADDSAGGLLYALEGDTSVATVDELSNASTTYPDWIVDRYLQSSATVTNRTVQLAQQIAADADATNPFAMSLAVESYLRSNYTYEENSPGPPDEQDWVDYFLFDYQSGRCEQYATSMVVLMRSLGVPSRLVSGYNVQGEQDETGAYLYREYQAHTWVEVFFPGYGWVPFEPTANLSSFSYADEAPTDTPLDASPEAIETPEATPEPDQLPSPESEASPIPPQLAVDDSSGDGGAVRTIRISICWRSVWF